jgi:SAM-dependent methyltransferase
MTIARYDAVADFYVSGFDSVDDSVSAALFDLVGSVAGLRVLDVACGHGRTTRELARRGADVVGIDIAGSLLARARQIEQDDPLGIRYVHADVTVSGVLEAAAFDVATCSFGLSDIDDLDGALATVASALRSGGRFVFSILHPCFSGGPEISGSWPDAGSYYDEGRWTASGERSTLRQRVGASHRTLSTYNATLRRHGFWLDRLVEPRPREDWDPAHDADRKPVFLVARAVLTAEAAAASSQSLRA